MTFPKRYMTAAGVIVAFAAFFGTGRAISSASRTGKAAEGLIRVESIAKPGRQYVFVYVGSSRCGPSNSPGLAAKVGELMELVRARAKKDGVGFVTIGVARETSALAGLGHLEKVAAFDEVAAGQGVLNQAAAHFISVDHHGMAATPQVIVVERTLYAGPSGVDPSRFDEHILLRKIGVAELGNWRRSNAPIPTLRATPDTGRVVGKS